MTSDRFEIRQVAFDDELQLAVTKTLDTTSDAAEAIRSIHEYKRNSEIRGVPFVGYIYDIDTGTELTPA